MTAEISSLERTELYRQLGIKEQPSATSEPAWVTVKLRFIGAECYVLGTKSVEAVLQHKSKGVSLLFRQQLEIPANVLLGKQIPLGKLYDVVVDFGSVSMSLASLHPGRYPIVLQRDSTVNLL